MKRPIGVWIIGILALINAIFTILGAITALGVTGLAMMGKLGTEGEGLGGEALIVGISSLIIGVILLVFALSFLRLRPWAWTALMIVELFVIVVAVVQFIFAGFHWSSLVTIIIPVIIVFYLTRPRIRQAFGD